MSVTRLAILLRIVAGVCLLLGTQCHGLQPKSHAANPLGWIGKVFVVLGEEGVRLELPLIEQFGRVARSVGDVLEFPALLVEGMVTLSPEQMANSTEKLLRGSGELVASAFNLLEVIPPGRRVDLSRDSDDINAALVYLETLPPEMFRLSEADPRRFVLPPGTRVRANKRHLIWTIPGAGEMTQVAKESVWFALTLASNTDDNTYVAQERTWGFVVPDLRAWNDRSTHQRVTTTIHEFYHQFVHFHQRFYGWSLVYWPAYGISFLQVGWRDHWAEGGDQMGAGVVDRALRSWRPYSTENE